MKITANGYIVIVFVAGLILIGYLVTESPDTLAQQLPLILAALGGSIAVIAKQGATDTEVIESRVIANEAKIAALQSTKVAQQGVDVSQENAHSIAAVSQQTAHALEQVNQTSNQSAQTLTAVDDKITGVHSLVNSQKIALEDKIAAQDGQILLLTAALHRIETTLDRERQDKDTLIAAALATPPPTDPHVELVKPG